MGAVQLWNSQGWGRSAVEGPMESSGEVRDMAKDEDRQAKEGPGKVVFELS